MVEFSEHQEQVGFVRWFRREFPGVLIFAIPNGEQRSCITGKKLKDEGVVPGIPDLFVPEFRMFIEMKRKTGGVVSKEQTMIMNRLTKLGYECIVAHGASEASRCVLERVERRSGL